MFESICIAYLREQILNTLNVDIYSCFCRQLHSNFYYSTIIENRKFGIKLFMAIIEITDAQKIYTN